MYQAHLPGAGIFQCSITGLGFKVKSAATITYRYATWSRHLSKADEEMWMPAGPLFHIRRVTEQLNRTLSPLLSLAEDVNTSLCSIAHFKSEKIILEKPTRLVAFFAVLENPSFSLLGAHLPFYYKSPKEQQLFVEIYIKNMAEEIGLLMTNTRDNTEVWRASLRSGDINPPAFVSMTMSGAAFLKKHKTKLCSRMRQFSTILLHLRDANVINSDEEEEVQGQNKSLKRNLILLDLIEKKSLEAQEQLYQILQMKDPYLIADLEKSG
ncbi:PREDICTED: NACHT, LRR and PYD domains-containing protein 1-like [Nestor notabilis]|uniref:NACHT, LRR and PYD domains-containing protein 1-like n=1 Tax=Nestor notabilis TaxID=176057 RepID=UPI000523E69F|nr:PREDICTED: NACHT, LRR and PYD domains-containing protein 1-like [Nestor notabilis]